MNTERNIFLAFIANGKGGLGRYIRHLEGRDGMSYYPNGNAFGYYSPGLFGFFGWALKLLSVSKIPLDGTNQIPVHTCYLSKPQHYCTLESSDKVDCSLYSTMSVRNVSPSKYLLLTSYNFGISRSKKIPRPSISDHAQEFRCTAPIKIISPEMSCNEAKAE